MQSLMHGESNRRMKMEIFRELDKGEAVMHMKFAHWSPQQ